MKTKVLKTTNGNFVAMINGIETYISADGKRSNPVETPCFEKLSKNTKVFEVEGVTPADIIQQCNAIFDEIKEAEKEAYCKLCEEWDATTEVERYCIGERLYQLRSNGKLYSFARMVGGSGWRKDALLETSRAAIRLRLKYNIPLDESNVSAEDLAFIKKDREHIIALESWKERTEKKTIAEYKALEANQPIEATCDNIGIILRYLNLTNWGGWELPKMTIGYSAHQYDCDGVIASTITLDKPISDEEYDITNETRFVVNAPNNYLNHYQRL